MNVAKLSQQYRSANSTDVLLCNHSVTLPGVGSQFLETHVEEKYGG